MLSFLSATKLSTRRLVHCQGRPSANSLTIYSVGASTLIILLGLCACEGGGQSQEPTPFEQENRAEDRSIVRNEVLETVQSLADRIETLEDLQDLSKFENGFQRNAALHLRLLQSDEQELMSLIEKAQEISRKSLRDTVSRQILHRLTTLNPILALDQVEGFPSADHEGFVELIFEEWSLLDLDKAIYHAGSLDRNKRLLALSGILKARDDLPKQDHREIAVQLGLTHYEFESLSRDIEQRVIASPETEWEELANDEQSDLSQVATFIEAAESWIERDGLEAIQRIYAMTTDWQILFPVLSTALHKTTLNDPQTTFENSLNLDFDTGDFLVRSIIQSWSTFDPQAAFDAVTTLESNALRVQLQDSVIRTWGRKDPHDLLSHIDRLPQSVKDLGREHAVVSLSRSSPEEAAGLFAKSEFGNKELSIANAIAMNWSNQDAYAALDWVLTDPEVFNIQQELLNVVLGNLVKKDPGLAMDIALKRPIEPNEKGLEAAVIGQLAYTDVQSALQMLPKVREGETKKAAFTWVGSQLIRDGEIEQALGLLERMQDTEQEDYISSIVETWAFSQPDDLVERLDELPSEELRSRAVYSLISFNQFRKAITDDQIDSIKEFLTEDDLEKLDSGPMIIEY